MERKNFFMVGILAMVLVFGMLVVGCDDSSNDTGSNDNGSEKNPFIGTWRSPEGGGYYVLVFTGSDWTITSPTGNVESGIYTWLPGQTSITMMMTKGGNGQYNVSISGNTLSFGSRTYTKS